MQFGVELNYVFQFDVLLVKKALYGEDSDLEDSISPKPSQKKTEWDWSDDESKSKPKQKLELLDTKKLHTSMSRSQNILAIAQNRQFIIIQNGKEYNLVDTACDADLEDEKITQILIIPFNNGARAIYAIAVGTSSGNLKFFTDSGRLLISQLLHRSSIQKLKLRTSPAISGDQVLVCIDGVSLHALLQSCLYQLTTSSNPNYSEAANDTLAYRKWKLQDQTVISDVTSVGLAGTSPFGTLHPLVSPFRIVCFGKDPMVAFYITAEREFRFSTAVAMASTVATKLTSAVFSYAKSWWGGKAEERTEEKLESSRIEKAIDLPLKWGLSDPQRHITSCTIDPTGRFCACTDTFNRVLLLDTVDNIIVRMWKGYRDAQVAWVQDESLNLDTEKFTMFLAIYAPRRGILEVWQTRIGPRLVLLEVGMGCKLLNTQTVIGANMSSSYCYARAYLMHSHGLVEEVVIKKK